MAHHIVATVLITNFQTGFQIDFRTNLPTAHGGFAQTFGADINDIFSLAFAKSCRLHHRHAGP